MNILDEVEEFKKGKKPNQVIFLALASLAILSFGLQLEAIYSRHIIQLNIVEYIGFTNCFFDSYPMRPIVHLFSILGIGLSLLVLYKRRWKFPDSGLYNLILLSPVIILIFDQLVFLLV